MSIVVDIAHLPIPVKQLQTEDIVELEFKVENLLTILAAKYPPFVAKKHIMNYTEYITIIYSYNSEEQEEKLPYPKIVFSKNEVPLGDVEDFMIDYLDSVPIRDSQEIIHIGWTF